VEVKWRKGKSCFSRNTDEQGIPEEAEKTESSLLLPQILKSKATMQAIFLKDFP